MWGRGPATQCSSCSAGLAVCERDSTHKNKHERARESKPEDGHSSLACTHAVTRVILSPLAHSQRDGLPSPWTAPRQHAAQCRVAAAVLEEQAEQREAAAEEGVGAVHPSDQAAEAVRLLQLHLRNMKREA